VVTYTESRGVDPDGNQIKFRVDIDAEEGTTQGEPLAGLLFSGTIKPAVDAVLQKYPNVRCRGIADDKYFFGPVGDTIAAVLMYQTELARVGLKLLPAKTTVYKPYDIDGIAAICAANGLAAGKGFSCGGVPVGDADYVQAELAALIDARVALCDSVRELWLANSFAGKATQNIYRIIRWCISPNSVNYLLRGLAPDVVAQQMRRFDAAVHGLTLSTFGAKPTDSDCSVATATGLLTDARLRLRARDGGLGIGSAMNQAKQAYVGSLCLVLHLVQAALGDAFTDVAAKGAFPVLAAAEADGTFAGCDALKGHTVANLLLASVERVQRKLSVIAGTAAAADVVGRIVAPEEKAWFLSGKDDGANFLTAYAPRGTAPLTDNQYTALVRARLNLTVVRGFDDAAAQACPSCSDIMRNGVPLAGHVTRLRRNGTHALHCQQPGRGGNLGRRTTQHHRVKFALVEALRPCARAADLHEGFLQRGPGEPKVTDYYPYKAGVVAAPDTDNNRADIAVNMNGACLLDVVVSHPVPNTNPACAAVAGAAAASAHEDKIKHYSIFDIPVGKCVPLSFETGGCFDPRTLSFFKAFVKFGLASGAETQPAWDAATRIEYNTRLRSICVYVSLAIARSVADTLLANVSVLPSRTLRAVVGGSPGPACAGA